MHDNILQSIGYATGAGRALPDPSPEEVLQFLGTLPFRTYLKPPIDLGYYPILNRLIREWGVTSILEVGVFRGYSACAMIWRNPVVRYIGIDPEEYMMGSLRQCWENLSRFNGLQDLTFELRRGYSQDVNVPSLGEFDLVYIDGDHSYEAALADFRRFWPAVSPGGRMIADDAVNINSPEVAPAIIKFSEEIGQEAEFVATIHGTGVWRKP